MGEAGISLLWPREEQDYKNTKKLSTTTAENLNLSELCNNISKIKAHADYAKEVLSIICPDEEVIEYRQEIFCELMENPLLLENLKEVLMRLDDLSLLDNKSQNMRSGLIDYFLRLRELNGYIDCFTDIDKAFDNISISSHGFAELKDLVKRTVGDPDFLELKDAIKSLTLEVNEIKSINIGMNLDSDLRPDEAAII